MSLTNNPYQNVAYLKEDQYRDAANLTARADLHRLFSTNPNGWHPWVFEQLQLSDGDNVLECGSGPGWLWRENVGRIPAGCQITLADLSPGMAAEAEAALSTSAVNFSFRETNIERLPFADEAFDVVVANHIMILLLKKLPQTALSTSPKHRVCFCLLGKPQFKSFGISE